jgi:hypothetical protein
VKELSFSFRSVYFFWISIAFYILYLSVIQSSWALSGSMWAEMGTNYFPNANANLWVQKLFSTDAGYIPFLQRLIGIAGYLLKLPASVIPYFYTWIGILLTALMVSVFCLERFRILIKSDALRFFTVLIVLVMADFETRTFINFTYFAVFPLAILTALAAVDRTKEVPSWAWTIPLLIISKPAILSVLPAMVIVALGRPRSRFFWITLVTVLLGFVQVLQMWVSQREGVFLSIHHFGIFEKISASIGYFFIFMNSYLLGKAVKWNVGISMALGVILAVMLSMVIKKKRGTPEVTLIILGLSLLFFNIFLNCFSLSDSWNTDFDRLDSFAISRHLVVSYWGIVLIVCGLSSLIFHFRNKWGIGVLLGWFLFSGWILSGIKMSHALRPPIIYNSQWQEMAFQIDKGARPLCVPLDPLGWMYAKNCQLLNYDLQGDWLKGFRFDSVPVSLLEVHPQVSLSAKELVSLAVLVQPSKNLQEKKEEWIDVKANIFLKDGGVRTFLGHQLIPLKGGLIMLKNLDMTSFFIPIKNISTVKLNFNQPVFLASLPSRGGDKVTRDPLVLWMGN